MVSVKFRRREDKLIKKYDFQSLNIWGLKEFDRKNGKAAIDQ